MSACSAVMMLVTPVAADVTYGELAPGASVYAEQSGVAAEICRDLLFVPSESEARLPPGYRLMKATDFAKGDPGLAALIVREPRYASYAVGSLCFVASDYFVDGVRVHPPGLTPMAFLWARAEGPKDAAADPRIKGKLEWVQLASWYAAKDTDHVRISAADPTAQFVDVTVENIAPNFWRMRLPLAGEVVEVEVRGSGNRVKRKKPEPGFMTVPLTGDSADRFLVFTYFGHHHQSAEGIWRAKGAGVFATSFAIDPALFPTYFQDGWQARSGLYKFEQPAE